MNLDLLAVPAVPSGAPDRVAYVDLDTISANVRRLRALAGTPFLMAVVKANGYGHGAVPVARAALAGGADWLGVADLAEARDLRAAGITARLLAWLHDPGADFGAAAADEIDIGVSSAAQLHRIAATAPGAAVQLKLDTGLSRNGVAPEEWAATFALAADLQNAAGLRVRGIFSHLANTSEASDAQAAGAFSDALRLARNAGLEPELTHLSATGAAIRHDQSAFTMVRTGIGIYGFAGADDLDSAALGLRPAMRLVSCVAAVRRVPAGTGVSYGATWRAPRPTTLALVPLGYADGVPRAASNRGEVWLNGARRPIRGRIAMDQFLVDMGDDPVAPGDSVVLFGDPATGVPGAGEWGAWADTIDYEIVTRIGARVQRRHIGG